VEKYINIIATGTQERNADCVMKLCRKSLLSQACTKDNREVEVDSYFSSVDPLQLLINRSVFSSNLCFFKSFCKVTSRREKHKTPPRLFSLCF